MLVANVAVHELLRRGHGLSDKQFVYADRAVFRPHKSVKTRCLSNINMREMMLNDWFNKIKVGPNYT